MMSIPIEALVVWALDIIGVACLLAKRVTKKYGKVSISEMNQERKEERQLKKLWKQEMG